jgi:type II secretory pathway component GspD/PulD (secretin)
MIKAVGATILAVLIIAVPNASRNLAPPRRVSDQKIWTDLRIHTEANRTVTIFFHDEDLRHVLKTIASQDGMSLLISPKLKPGTVTISASASPIGEVMQSLCEARGCRWKVETHLVVWSLEEATPEWCFDTCSEPR